MCFRACAPPGMGHRSWGYTCVCAPKCAPRAPRGVSGRPHRSCVQAGRVHEGSRIRCEAGLTRGAVKSPVRQATCPWRHRGPAACLGPLPCPAQAQGGLGPPDGLSSTQNLGAGLGFHPARPGDRSASGERRPRCPGGRRGLRAPPGLRAATWGRLGRAPALSWLEDTPSATAPFPEVLAHFATGFQKLSGGLDAHRVPHVPVLKGEPPKPCQPTGHEPLVPPPWGEMAFAATATAPAAHGPGSGGISLFAY